MAYTQASRPQITDQQMDTAIGYMLRTGVFLAAAVVFLGAVLSLAHDHGQRPDYSHFQGVAANLRSPSAILHGALALDGPSIIQLGLLLLIATPIARVLLAAAYFFVARDRLYVAVSLAVFAILLYSLLRSS